MNIKDKQLLLMAEEEGKRINLSDSQMNSFMKGIRETMIQRDDLIEENKKLKEKIKSLNEEN